MTNNISENDKALLMNQISNDLDNYISSDIENLFNLPIETLYTIFNNSHNFTLHNEAYEMIAHKNQDINKYTLLKFLDAKKLNEKYVSESIELYEQRNFFIPKNSFSMLLINGQKYQKKVTLFAFLLFTLILICAIFNYYHLNITIQKKDNIINSLHQKIDQQFEKNTEKDNNINSLNQEINQQFEKNKEEMNNFFHNQRNLIIGTLFFSTRNEERLPGALKCNGQTVNADEFPLFVEKYLKANLVAVVQLERWEQIKNTANNVGYFGYDQNGGIFKTPFIPSGSYLSNANVDKVNGDYIKQGNYLPDQIVNMNGKFHVAGGDQGHSEIWHADGVFQGCCRETMPFPSASGNSIGHPRGVSFNASRVVRTGDRVMPRSIFYNLYVVVD